MLPAPIHIFFPEFQLWLVGDGGEVGSVTEVHHRVGILGVFGPQGQVAAVGVARLDEVDPILHH